MNIGKFIYADSNEWFDYEDRGRKVIIGEGSTWIVCKDMNSGNLCFVQFNCEYLKNRKILQWEE